MNGLARSIFAAAWVVLSLHVLPLRAKAPETISFQSDGKTLHGLLYKPAGPGPFRTVLYNHGSAPGLLNNQAFALLAPLFTSRGWAFFAPWRRGQGLSADAGPYIGKEISSAHARGGLPLAAKTMVRLLDTEQLKDQMAALAWLERQPFTHDEPIAVMGNSFGGVETVLGASDRRYCAAVDAAGGAESWDKAPRIANADASGGSTRPGSGSLHPGAERLHGGAKPCPLRGDAQGWKDGGDSHISGLWHLSRRRAQFCVAGREALGKYGFSVPGQILHPLSRASATREFKSSRIFSRIVASGTPPSRRFPAGRPGAPSGSCASRRCSPTRAGGRANARPDSAAPPDRRRRGP